MLSKSTRSDIALVLVFVIIGLLTRTTYHMGANIELITALSIAAPFFLKNKGLSFFVPLGAMIFSDLVIGNTIIFTFTWSAFLLAPVIGILLNNFAKKRNVKTKLLTATGGNLISNVIFFLWTNFGVVLTTTMYSKDLAGVMQSYINALPFFRNQLVSGLIFTPMVFLTTLLVVEIHKFLKGLNVEKLDIRD